MEKEQAEKETDIKEKDTEEKSTVEKHYDHDCVEVEWIPFGVMSFEELEAAQDAKAAALKTKELAEQFKQLTLNIMSNQEIEDKAAAVKALADEFSDRVTLAMEQKEKWQPLTNAAKRLVSKIKKKDRPEPELELGDIPESAEDQSFTIWKEKDGNYRWLAIYSNNYRDDDSPPEIISKEAHLDFVRAVDEGEWPSPELRYWHIKGTRWGQADFIAYDENTGFSVAAGTVDKVNVAERVMQRDGLAVSHGMPTKEIRRDENDPTIITRYRSVEISVLPKEAAANKITNFMTISKETEDIMAIPEHKKQELEEMGFDTEALEAKLQSGKAQAGEEGREQKEVKTQKTKDEQAETAQPETAPETPEPQASEPQTPEPLTAEVITAAFTAVMQPVMERIETLEGQIKGLAEEVETKEEPLDLTPAASLASMFVSGVLGQSAARVDGRKTRHDAPKEATKAKGPQVLNSGSLLADDVINQLLDPEGAWVNDLPTGQPQ